MSSLESERWSEGLKLISFCPVCDTRYNPTEARLLAEQGETHLLHVQCRKCQHAILALVLVNQMGASTVGLLTDLSHEDVVKCRSHKAISIDEVIQTHLFFQKSDWVQVLGSRLPGSLTQLPEKRTARVRKSQKAKITKKATR